MPSLTAIEQEAHAPVRPLLEVRGVWKSFGGVQAVIDASLSLGAGRVYGLAGENGAGKSTLGKIIAGALAPDDGETVPRRGTRPLPGASGRAGRGHRGDHAGDRAHPERHR